MNVGQLIELLSTHYPDLEVMIDDDEYGPTAVNSVKLVEDVVYVCYSFDGDYPGREQAEAELAARTRENQERMARAQQEARERQEGWLDMVAMWERDEGGEGY